MLRSDGELVRERIGQVVIICSTFDELGNINTSAERALTRAEGTGIIDTRNNDGGREMQGGIKNARHQPAQTLETCLKLCDPENPRPQPGVNPYPWLQVRVGVML